MNPSAKTYRQWTDWGTASLREAGIEEPRRTSSRLLMLATGLSSLDTIRREHQLILDETVVTAFKSFIQRRMTHEPLQHIEGETWFYGRSFKTDHRALIPRDDSEILVDEVLKRLPLDGPRHVADLGTGTGCLLLTVLLERPQLIGTGVELSEEAAALATENVDLHQLADRVTLANGGWQAWTGWADADLILSNPPYIDKATLSTLAPEVRDFDPVVALDGGVDGLTCYRDIIKRAAANMKVGAWLCFEIGYDQGETVPGLLRTAGFSDISVHQDLSSHDRVVCARK